LGLVAALVPARSPFRRWAIGRSGDLERGQNRQNVAGVE